MKRISLVAVIALFASVAGLAQTAKIEVKYDTTVVYSGNTGHNRANSTVSSESWVTAFPKSVSSVQTFRLSVDTATFLQTFPKSVSSVQTSIIPRTDPFLDMLFNGLVHKEGVNGITVTKSLLDLIPEIDTYVEVNGITIKKVIAKLEQIDVYSSKNDDAKKIIRGVCEDASIHKSNIVVLMRIKNENENIVFYGEKEMDYFRSVIMFSDNKEECVLIRLTGQFFKDDIKQIITDKKKSAK
jgi:hypothetical protein